MTRKPQEELGDLGRYLADPEAFAAKWLHDYSDESEREDGLRYFERIQWLAWKRLRSATIAPGFRLNILVVDNEPWETLKGATDAWAELLNEPVNVSFVRYDRVPSPKDWKATSVGPGAVETTENSEPLDWPSVDLVLQDIYLGTGKPLGYELAERYFEIAPQAMVFLLTSMELEALASSGVTHKADRTLSKRRVKGMLWEYYSRFTQLFGELLWPVWARASSTDVLRHLFGSLRRWQLEPEILFHGYALPEMVEHAHRHTSGLWQMTQDIVVPLLNERGHGERFFLTDEERILLCLGIWLHDVGHVGNEHFVDSVTIRALHGSISDRHLLRNPKALGLDWLLDYCQADCRDTATRLSRLNRTKGCSGGAVCPLRRAGLLARYHQQSAPMVASGVLQILEKGKPLTPYCRVQLEASKPDGSSWHEAEDSTKDVSGWMARDRALGWEAHTVRTLEDFWRDPADAQSADLLKLEQLLRWLDGLHLHECRVGSGTRLETLRNFLRVRGEHVADEIKHLERLLDIQGAHDAAGIGMRARLDDLYYYSRLLRAQDVHQWLHSSVRDVRVREGRIVFTLRSDMHEHLPEVFGVKDHQGALEVWKDLCKDFIASELGHVDPASALGRVINRPIYDCRLDGNIVTILEPAPRPDAPRAHRGSESRVQSKVEPEGDLFIDCDPGIDDAIGLIVAARWFKRIEASATSGTVGVEQTLRNARLVVSIVRSLVDPQPEFHLSRGASASLLGDRSTGDSVQGRDGLGEVPLLPHIRNLVSRFSDPEGNAVVRLLELGSKERCPNVTIVFTGPLTDLALALLQSANAHATMKNLGRLFIAGGTFHPSSLHQSGSVTPSAEFNLYFDPQALQIVLGLGCESDGSGGTDEPCPSGLYFVPLAVTERVQLFAQWISRPETPQQNEKRKALAWWSYAILQKNFDSHLRAFRQLDLETPLNPAASLAEANFRSETFYSEQREKIKCREGRGKPAGDIVKPMRFCHMHGALAVWVAAQCRREPKRLERWFRTARIVVHSGRDALRGSVHVIDGKRPELTDTSYQPGTLVHFLSPQEFTIDDYREFIEDLFGACSWEFSPSWRQLDTQRSINAI
jgi:inosine-uridine nucleoside N-ribohydrolase